MSGLRTGSHPGILCSKGCESLQTPANPCVIDLWLLRCDEHDGRLVAACEKLLDAAELDQAGRYVRRSDQHSFVLRRALLRCALSRRLSRPPGSWPLGSNPHHKPVLSECMDVAFSITHDVTWSAVAVGQMMDLGIDIEGRSSPASITEVAERFCTADEHARFSSLSEPGRALRALELWTLKESYVKALGVGLSMPLTSFGFDLNDGPRVGTTHIPAPWQFWQGRFGADRLLAICAGTTQRRLRVRVTRVTRTPNAGSDGLRLVPLRCSVGFDHELLEQPDETFVYDAAGKEVIGLAPHHGPGAEGY